MKSTLVFQHARLGSLMDERGLTDGKLAYKTGMSKSMIYYMRTGQRPQPSAAHVASIAQALSCSIEYLMGSSDDLSPRFVTLPPALEELADQIVQLSPQRRQELKGIIRTLLEVEREEQETFIADLRANNALLDAAQKSLDADELNRLFDALATFRGMTGPELRALLAEEPGDEEGEDE